MIQQPQLSPPHQPPDLGAVARQLWRSHRCVTLQAPAGGRHTLLPAPTDGGETGQIGLFIGLNFYT